MNPDLINCPITLCELKEPDCNTTLESPANITIEETFPFAISGALGIDVGYNYSVCIQCTVNDTITNFGNYSIRQIRDCDTHI